VTELAPRRPLAAERAILAACAGVTVEHGTGGGAVRALEDVDVALHEGESVALWGPSGRADDRRLPLGAILREQ
jgi:predicted ABC-type transport system involved in lysophospholipase L1 biosynthesis ATPase subunit